MSRSTLSLATILALTAAPLAASPIAEVICAPTDEMTERLITQFGESRVGPRPGAGNGNLGRRRRPKLDDGRNLRPRRVLHRGDGRVLADHPPRRSCLTYPA